MNHWNQKGIYTTWNYRKTHKGGYTRYSAGVLPYTFDQTGKCLFLLGKLLFGCCFGGAAIGGF